jgi:hypothetical protein
MYGCQASLLYCNIWSSLAKYAMKQNASITQPDCLPYLYKTLLGLTCFHESTCHRLNTEIKIWKMERCSNLLNGIWGLLCLLFLTDRVSSWLHKLLLLGTRNVVGVQSERKKKWLQFIIFKRFQKCVPKITLTLVSRYLQALTIKNAHIVGQPAEVRGGKGSNSA